MGGVATSENTTFGVLGEIRFSLTRKTSYFLFLLCFSIAIIQLVSMHQPSRQKLSFSSFVSGHFDDVQRINYVTLAK